MKINKLLYLSTILITFLTFNIKGYCDETEIKELTCFYNYQDDGSVILSQDKKGKISIFINETNLDEFNIAERINKDGWKKLSEEVADFENTADETIRTTGGILLKCPVRSKIKQKEEKVLFYDEANLGLSKPNLAAYVNDDKTPKKYEFIATGLSCAKVSILDEVWIEKFDEKTMQASCLYANDVDEGCHIIQLNIGKDEQINVVQRDPALRLGTFFFVDRETVLEKDEASINISNIKEKFNGWCPNQIYVDRDTFGAKFTSEVSLQLENRKKQVAYKKIRAEGLNINDTSIEQTDRILTDYFPNIGKFLGKLDCVNLFGGDGGEALKDLLKIIVNIVKFAILILLIGIGIIDFFKATFAGKEDEMKKAQYNFIRRIIIGVCIFLIPNLLEFVLTITNSIWETNISADFCGIL